MSDAAYPAPGLDADARAAILNAEVAKYARKGWTVSSVSPGQAVLTKTKRIGLIGNLLLVLITAGIWLIWVIYRALNRKSKTMIISVDAKGKISYH